MHPVPKILFSLVALAALQACITAPVENPDLTAAQQQYQVAQGTPAVATLADAELRDARVALEQAQGAWRQNAMRAEVDHLAYMASKKVAIAEELARLRLAEQSISEAEGRRDQTLRVARTLEAQAAERAAQTKAPGAE